MCCCTINRVVVVSALAYGRVMRLEHAFITVRDVGASLAFYRAMFPEWGVRWEGLSSRGPWVHFGDQAGGQSTYLSIAQNANAKATADEKFEAQRIDHLGFVCPDVDGWVARLAEAGIAPFEHFTEAGYHRAYFRDPDGHELELVQAVQDE